LLGVLWCGALLIACVQLGPMFERALALPAAIGEARLRAEVWAQLALCAWIALSGRVALACLAPGQPGGGALRASASTWAASHVLGCALLALQAACFELAGGAAQAHARLGNLAALGLWAAPTALLALARVFGAPGALRPRHEPAHEAPDWSALLTRCALALAFALTAVIAFGRVAVSERALGTLPARGAAELLEAAGALLGGRAHPSGSLPLLALASWAALLLVLQHALAAARRAPFPRAAVALLYALTPAAVASAGLALERVQPALCIGAGAACLIPWLRRAERRAAQLAAIAFAAALPHGGTASWTAVCGLALLVLASARPARRRALVAALTATLVLGLPLVRVAALRFDAHGSLVSGRHALELGRSALDTAHFALLAPALVLAFVLLALRWSMRAQASVRASAAAVDEPGSELVALIALLVAAGLLSLALELEPSGTRASAGATAFDARRCAELLAPIAALVLGLVYARGEQPANAAR